MVAWPFFQFGLELQMIVTPGLSTWLLLRLAIGLIVVLACSRAMFGAYQRGRDGRGVIAKLPSFAFNLLVVGVTLHILAMMTVGAQMVLFIIYDTPELHHLFLSGTMLSLMVLTLPMVFGVLGNAVYRDHVKASS